ncbi:hypothetical protein [Elizabethkingia meningoseptica]
MTRLQNIGQAITRYTYNRRPVKLVYYCNFSGVNDAVLFEKQVKG